MNVDKPLFAPSHHLGMINRDVKECQGGLKTPQEVLINAVWLKLIKEWRDRQLQAKTKPG
jgi:hypothetical protein